ncbi:MAG: zinc D-Ala-D-Ala carboxypeptidase [Actinomycetota bacterium]|jgi:hypothetical protein
MSRRRPAFGAFAIVSVALVSFVLVDRSSATSGHGASRMPAIKASTSPTAPSGPPDMSDSPDRLPRAEQVGLGDGDGVVPAGVTVFDDEHPAVGKLDPALLAALRRAATSAAHDGITLYVDSGWRSRAYQAQLLRSAIAKYGSAREAARWVATPDTSAHVSGDAVDIGHARAAAWLSRHGAAFGLCRIYANESWHFELRPNAVTNGCPRMYADAAHDPRMQRA